MMNDSLSQIGRVNETDVFGNEGIMSLYVNTENPGRRFMVCCRRDEPISMIFFTFFLLNFAINREALQDHRQHLLQQLLC